ncbi:MAG: TetR family transcriptional regulator [bacterium]
MKAKNNSSFFTSGKPAKAEATRQRIYEAALGLFQEKDFGQTTMRDIAKRAGVALGATYYYFKSKDDIVMEFYRNNQKAAGEECGRVCREIPDFQDRVRAVLMQKFAQFGSSRHFLNVLFRTAGDPKNPLSPFSPETKAIREEAIGLFEKCLVGCDLKIAEDFRPYLPRLLWFYQMALILFWIHDDSPGQENTRKLMDKSLKLILKLLSLSRFPFLGGLRRDVLEMMQVTLEEGGFLVPPPASSTPLSREAPTPEQILEVGRILLEETEDSTR